MNDSSNRFDRAGCSSRYLSFALVFMALILQVRAQTYTLSSANSTATIQPNSQNGMNSWVVDGVNQLNQQWFWYALGNTAPASIDTISPAAVTPSGANEITTAYTGGGYNLSVDYTLTGGSPGSGVSDMGESIRINNTGASTLSFRFYEYSDFDLQGVPGPAIVSITGPRGAFNDAYQTVGGLALTETVVAPSAAFAEANNEGGPGSTLARLNGGLPLHLNDNTLAAGNVTWAFEWDLNIAPGGTALISKDKYLQTTVVPEPAVWALLPLGGLMLSFVQRRRQKA
jgi:hypothetical protein